jgi:aspartate-semialdehyde dehydrogenase
MQLVPLLMALRDSVGLERVVVDTYQAVSGTGNKASRSWRRRSKAHVAGEPRWRPSTRTRSPSTRSRTSTSFLDNGYTKEEWKVVTESRKILHLPDLRVSCTAVRVPVFMSHSEAVHVETRDPITPERARELFAAVPGVVVEDDPAAHVYPLATRAAGSRRDLRGPRPPRTPPCRTGAGSPSGCVSDNLRKGAATNAVQIAEILVATRLAQARATGRGGRGTA